MDALKFNKKFLGLCLFAVSACSNSGSEIDAAAKKELLSSTVILASVKQQCLPLAIIDEEDLPLITRQGYTLSPNNEYCLPPIDTNDGDDTVSNCIRELFIDDTDLAYLISIGYVPGANGDYCLVIGGGTSGGSTSGGTTAGATSGSDIGGSTSAGTTSGGTTTGATTGSDNGGSTSAGSTSGSTTAGATSGSDIGGSTSAGATSGGSTTGSDTGGSTTAGATSGGSTTGSDTGGSTSAGATSGGSTTGSDTGGSTSAGTTSGGSTSAGSTSGGSTSGGTTSGGSSTGGSTSGGECVKGNNGDGTDDDGVAGDGHCPPVDDCEMNLIPGLNAEVNFAKCNPWNVPVDRVCSRIRTSSGRFKLQDRLELVLRVVKRVETVQEIEVCKTEKTNWWDSDDDDDDSHTHKSDCKHGDKKIVCRNEKKKVVTMLPICESRNTAQIKNDVIEKKRLDLSSCDISGHKKSDLYVTLFSPVEGGDLPVSKSEYENVRFFAKDSDKRGKDEISFIMYGSREVRYAKLTEKIQVITDDNPDFNSKVDKKKCDMKASPLIVHVNPDHDQARYVELSSIADGIQFNILGFNAEPRKNAPHQISWLNTDQYMFLVKPNKKGRVEGVDEMFGDNTRGPDKDFSANGFLALAKFDSNEDGLINSKDAVFKSLRLWKDKNFDGIGTANELVSLDQMKVKNIDLNYDPGFYERDAHGNETVYKSVIQYQDGSLDLIFDLWFNYKK